MYHLARATGHLSAEDSVEILDVLRLYGPPFVLPVRVGEVTVVSGEDGLQEMRRVPGPAPR